MYSKPDKITLHYTEFAGEPDGCAWKFQIRIRGRGRDEIRLRVAACDKTVACEFTVDVSEIGNYEEAFKQLIDSPMKGLPATVAACAKAKLAIAQSVLSIAWQEDDDE